MTIKAMSIIGRIIGLLFVVALAFGITWCATHWSKVQAEWDKIFNKTPQQEQPNEPDQPTPDKPSEEQINLDGLYYFDVDGDTIFVQIKDSKYGTIHGYIQDSNIYLASDWESEIELEPLHITEDEKYLHVFWIDQENGQEDKIAIYDKATKKLYYDFSNGEQFPGETYEDQLLFEMIKFENFELHEHSFNEIVYSCPPSCNAAGREIRKCLCKKTEMIETSPALGHDYVNGVCTRCGESDPNYVEACEHDWVKDLSYVPTAPSCGEYWDTQYKCSKCNETKLEKNGPLPHDWVDGVCSRCGTQCQHVHENGHICPICGCEVEKKLTWRVGKPATCTENGVEYGDCICGYNSEIREIPALGHDYVNGVCTRCGEEVALTWLINEKPDYQGNETLRVTIPLIAGGNSYDGIQIEPTVKYPAPACIIRFSSGLEMYNGKAFWSEFADRTITFETAPTGDLLAWLQANATPQV